MNAAREAVVSSAPEEIADAYRPKHARKSACFGHRHAKGWQEHGNVRPVLIGLSKGARHSAVATRFFVITKTIDVECIPERRYVN